MKAKANELAKLVDHCFKERESLPVYQNLTQSSLYQWNLPQLGNPYANPDSQLSPSKLKDYLNCPFRFYLKHILKLKPYQASPWEMDAMVFGNHIHRVLEQLGKEETLLRESRAEKISEFLLAEQERDVTRTYGKDLPVALLLQKESARERLKSFAKTQAKMVEEGWQIQHSEWEIGKDQPWIFRGQAISLKIDRVDFNSITSEYRIIDYKTGQSKEPKKAHLQVKRDEEKWVDLQLPLYWAAFQAVETPNRELLSKVAYACLPENLSKTGICEWEGFEQKLESAWEVFDHAVADIRLGKFWPPKEVKYDDYETFFPQGIEQAISPQQQSYLQQLPPQAK